MADNESSIEVYEAAGRDADIWSGDCPCGKPEDWDWSGRWRQGQLCEIPGCGSSTGRKESIKGGFAGKNIEWMRWIENEN